MYAISDVANEHLLTVEGDWLPKPIDEEDVERLLTFPARAEAAIFCRKEESHGRHVRPYALAEYTQQRPRGGQTREG